MCTVTTLPHGHVITRRGDRAQVPTLENPGLVPEEEHEVCKKEPHVDSEPGPQAEGQRGQRGQGKRGKGMACGCEGV